MTRKNKIILFYSALTVVVLSVMASILGVAGTMVSMKYGSLPDNPNMGNDGTDYQKQIIIIEVLGGIALVLFVLMIVFKDKMVPKKKSSEF